LELSIRFSLEIMEYVELLESKRKFVIANQLLRAATSVGANCHEAQSAESLADFIHKLKIASKEAVETEYWLKLCQASPNYPDPKNLFDMNLELLRLLGSIITTAKKKLHLQSSSNH